VCACGGEGGEEEEEEACGELLEVKHDGVDVACGLCGLIY